MIIFKVTFVSDFFEDNHLLVFTNEFHWLKNIFIKSLIASMNEKNIHNLDGISLKSIFIGEKSYALQYYCPFVRNSP